MISDRPVTQCLGTLGDGDKMDKNYMLAIDQSTQGTKALLLDRKGQVMDRCDLPHRQMIDENGWVEHDLEEIWQNTRQVVRDLLDRTGIGEQEIAGLGISNQRETIAAWNRETGKPVYHGIVWQCSRGVEICEAVRRQGYEKLVKARTGLDLSPYFSASKLSWILQNVPEAETLAKVGKLCCGTIDSWLLYCMTDGTVFQTDYSNASRTQLMNLKDLCWDSDLCEIFGIPMDCLPEIVDSDSLFGRTDLGGVLNERIPICCMMGDSHGALFGQGCHQPGMTKATYGTGSSVMMHVGDTPIFSDHGLVSSVAWGSGGKVSYVLEGNINYTGAVITWLKDKMELIKSAEETEELARKANPKDKTYIVPAFTGLGAPYWRSEATALITGMTRTTGKAELVKAALECIAYQIRDVVASMGQDLEAHTREQVAFLRVDGGPTRNRFLMQFQSDILNLPLEVPRSEELSAIGVGYMGGIRLGFYDKDRVFAAWARECYAPQMEETLRNDKLYGWKQAIGQTLFR